MLYLECAQFEKENPYFYCWAWLTGVPFSSTRARGHMNSRRPYDPDKEIKNSLRHALATQLHGENSIYEPPAGEVIFQLVTFHPLPKKLHALNRVWIDPRLFLGATQCSKDVDNISKIYMDALNPRRASKNQHPLKGVLWQDDRQCVMLQTSKFYAINNMSPGVAIQAWFRKEPMSETILRHVKGKNYDKSPYIRRSPPRYSNVDRQCFSYPKR